MFTRFIKIKMILNESSNFYTAANCLKMATSDTAHDIFAADVLLSQIMLQQVYIYILLQQKHKRQQQEEKGNKNKKEVIRRFCKLI